MVYPERRRRHDLSAWTIFAILVLGENPPARSAEIADARIEYVRKLQEGGLADLAVDYLKSLPSEKIVGELGEQFDYQLGKAILESASSAPFEREREMIDEALTHLEKYRAEHPDTDEAMDARGEITGVSVARAQRLFAEARLAENRERAGQLRAEGLSLIDRVAPELDSIVERYEKLLASTVAPVEEQQRMRRRRPAARETRSPRQMLLEARKLDVELRRGIVDYLAGQAFDRSSPEEKKKSDERLGKAVTRFNQLFQKYRSAGTLVASYALLWEGRVRQELGQMQEAEDIYKEVLSGEPAQTTGVDEVRAELWSQARLFWCQIKNLTGQPEEIVNNRYYSAVPWLNRSAERRRERFALGIQLELAKAYISLAGKLPADDKESRRMMRDAMKLLSDGVCRYSSEFMPEGFALREKYASQVSGAGEEMSSFDEAMFVGGTALAAKDWGKAIESYRRAIELARRETSNEQLAEARYRLAIALVQSDQVEEGLQIAVELTEGEPAKFSADAAGLLVATRWKQYREAASLASEGDASANKEKVTADLRLAMERVTSRFPKSPQADTARFLRGFLLGAEKKFEESAAAYQEVTSEASNFAESRLRAGQMLWGAFRDKEQRKESVGSLGNDARRLLQESASAFDQDRTETGEIPIGGIEARLTEARLLSGMGQAKEALAKVAPLVEAVKTGMPTGIDRFSVDILVTAVESAMAADQLDQAEKIVDAMMATPKGGERVSLVLVRLGKSMQEEVNRLASQGETAKAETKKKSLEDFLSKLAKRPDQGVATLRYLADSYEAIGRPAEAALTLASAIDQIKQREKESPEREKLINSLQARRVRALRQTGEYARALEEVDSLLSTHRMSGKKTFPLPLEFERCEILDSWGQKEASRGPEALSAWTNLAEKLRGVASKPREFFLARIGMAKWTTKQKGPAAGVSILKSTLTLHPEGGGPDLKREIESLLNEWSSR
jgi:tetratricopeptide (TPR) repeat protein